MTPYEQLVIKLLRMILRMVAAFYFVSLKSTAPVHLEEYIQLNEECAAQLGE